MSDLFEEKAEEWDTNDLIAQLSRAVGAAMLREVPWDPSMTVLDFGAGTGLVSSHLAPRVASIVAVDISQAMLDKLAAKPALAGKVEVVCRDILEAPLDRRFDAVVSAMAAHHVEDTDRLLRTLWAHLVPGGRLALADLDAEDGTFHPADVEGVFHAGFERADLGDRLARAGFDDVRFVTAHTVEKDGGAWPVFLVTAVKG